MDGPAQRFPGGFGIAVVIWVEFLVKRIDGGHDVNVDVVVIEGVEV